METPIQRNGTYALEMALNVRLHFSSLYGSYIRLALWFFYHNALKPNYCGESTVG